MKAFFIGYSKCGTKTMQVVFKTLGYNSYDVDDIVEYQHDGWTKILKEGGTTEDFKKLYANVEATSDGPAYHFWEDILKAFPDVKLLVYYRDEDAWAKSFQNQMDELEKDTKFQMLTMLSPTAQKFVRFTRLMTYQVWGADRGAWPWQFCTRINFTLLRKRYRQHNLYIQEKAPKDQLHVVDFSKGWEPICEFLGKPVPDLPFPHANQAGQIFKQYMEVSPLFLRMKREFMISVTVIGILLAIGMFFLARMFFL